MAPQSLTASLTPVQASDVERWLQEAWPNQSHYPDKRRCHEAAIRINAIVDRHNASPRRSAAERAIKEQRANHIAAKKHARALKRALEVMLHNLQNELVLTTVEGMRPINDELDRQISTTKQAQASAEGFLSLPSPPKFRDHADPILWIAKAAKEAWRDIPPDASKSQKAGMFGNKPESALTDFIRLVLEGIGLAVEGQPGNSLETISDHLRERHNRPRKARAVTSKEGGK